MTDRQDAGYDRDRFRTDASYRDGVGAGVAFMAAAEEREKSRRAKESWSRWEELRRTRLFGWEGEAWVCYFWRSGWDHLSFGLHVCFGGPNIEIHLPFGFLRIGRRTDVRERRAVKEAADA
ncbi:MULTISPECIES: hypothetical protein [unclassified Bradyrhizobium]|uniref:hypothetical protein n=1 Tax=Bradyrhizobium sp. USDA 4541 TaxID=2817704 RepID=UPI0020A32A2E|nr:hypothetical protein [Bradyrhizobium sp. USDA 4541]MCP1852886.1 hypothetical protein [Bradyrhizobium sp. USDA 4541]